MTELTSLIVVEDEQANMTNQTLPEESFGMIDSPGTVQEDAGVSSSRGVLKLTPALYIMYIAATVPIFINH